MNTQNHPSASSTTRVPASQPSASSRADAADAPDPDRDQLTPAALRPFQRSHLAGSLWQIANSLLPYLALWAVMIQTAKYSYPLTLLVAVVASAFLVRVFIIFHDCGHGSFFPSKRANEWVGFFTGLLTLTPHFEWWRNHSLHHAHTGNLDKRGDGDVWTLTVEEFRRASGKTRLGYRLVRNPMLMLVFGPFLVFVIQHRFPSRASRARERRGIHLTNVALAAGVALMCLTVGWKTYLSIHIPVLMMSGAMGIWLFYVQHQFENAYWRRDEECSFLPAALDGSSWYRLPRLLQWFSGNIGFHHVHHLSPRIPNYNLERCHHAFAALQRAHQLTLRSSLNSARLRLWDEHQKRMIGWREALRTASPQSSSPADLDLG